MRLAPQTPFSSSHTLEQAVGAPDDAAKCFERSALLDGPGLFDIDAPNDEQCRLFDVDAPSDDQRKPFAPMDNQANTVPDNAAKSFGRRSATRQQLCSSAVQPQFMPLLLASMLDDAVGEGALAEPVPDHHQRRQLSPLDVITGAVTTLAGSSQGFGDGDDGNARFNHPVGVAIDPNGTFALVSVRRPPPCTPAWRHPADGTSTPALRTA